MKVSSFKSTKLDGCCPLCGATDTFKTYLNGGQCTAKVHEGKDFFFHHDKNKEIYRLQVIEGQSSIMFDFQYNYINVSFPDDKNEKLPFFDMDCEKISIKAIKQLLIFA